MNYMWRKQPFEMFDKTKKSPEAVNGKAVSQSSGEPDTAVAVPLVITYYIQVLFISRSLYVRLSSCLCMYKVGEKCARSG